METYKVGVQKPILWPETGPRDGLRHEMGLIEGKGKIMDSLCVLTSSIFSAGFPSWALEKVPH